MTRPLFLQYQRRFLPSDTWMREWKDCNAMLSGSGESAKVLYSSVLSSAHWITICKIYPGRLFEFFFLKIRYFRLKSEMKYNSQSHFHVPEFHFDFTICKKLILKHWLKSVMSSETGKEVEERIWWNMKHEFFFSEIFTLRKFLVIRECEEVLDPSLEQLETSQCSQLFLIIFNKISFSGIMSWLTEWHPHKI